jgi:hypothetical protein
MDATHNKASNLDMEKEDGDEPAIIINPTPSKHYGILIVWCGLLLLTLQNGSFLST